MFSFSWGVPQHGGGGGKSPAPGLGEDFDYVFFWLRHSKMEPMAY